MTAGGWCSVCAVSGTTVFIFPSDLYHLLLEALISVSQLPSPKSKLSLARSLTHSLTQTNMSAKRGRGLPAPCGAVIYKVVSSRYKLFRSDHSTLTELGVLSEEGKAEEEGMGKEGGFMCWTDDALDKEFVTE